MTSSMQENGTSLDYFTEYAQDNFTGVVQVYTNGSRRGFYPRRMLTTIDLIQLKLENIGMPLILSLGIVSNIILVCTFLATPVGRHPLSIYLTAIGLADLTYLVCCIILWISSHGFDMYNHTGMCQLTTYALFLSTFLSTWYLVSAHLERCFWQFGPRRRKKWCTKFRSKCIIIAVSIFSMVAYLYALWTHLVLKVRGGVYHCMPMPESLGDIEKLRKVEIVFSVFIPMVLIIFMDIILLIKCVHGKCCGESKSKPSARSVRMSTRVSAALETNVQDLSAESSSATLACVICGIMYIVLFLPSVYLRAKLFFTEDRRSRDFQLMGLFENLVKFNAFYKFFLFVILLRSFRRGLVTLFTRTCRRKRRNTSSHERCCSCCEKQSPGPQETAFV